MSFGETLHRPALRTSERDRRCSQRANLQMSSILGIVLISVCALFIPNSSKRRLGYSPEPVVEGASRWSSERRTLPEHMLQRRGHKGFRPIFDSFTSAVGGGISGRPAYESTRDATRTGKAFAKAGGASGDAVSNKSTSRTTRGRPDFEEMSSHSHSHSHGQSHGKRDENNPNEDAWNKHCETYDDDSKDFVAKAIPTIRKVLKDAGIQNFAKERRALDFGAGTGNVAIPLAAEFYGHVTAVDVSKGMLDVLAKKSKEMKLDSRIKTLHAELTPSSVVNKSTLVSTPNGIEKESYDLVVCSMVLHHIPDRESAIQMFKAMLKPNGILLILEFQASEKEEDKKKLESKKETHGVFHDGINTKNFLDMMTISGLNVLHANTSFSFSFKEMSMDVFVGAAQKPENDFILGSL
eukprot:CAMPEP_0167743786 /NCGR_PEP_ID=MMETSP0110_2-20121227/2210_1 /TAXON_ID=629695 /ORGANISM="Gymnochlora sp., Strain CCMP2014" /LENGTH=408 /DNA_ID=CAMNT_0007628197 /DNA_START=1535 /DNA_END=2761 /DNA_ORIENTATION=-